MDVYEGDIFDTVDSFWGNRSNIYLAEDDNTFVRLIYIKGKGYLRKGKLNIDEEGGKKNRIA